MGKIIIMTIYLSACLIVGKTNAMNSENLRNQESQEQLTREIFSVEKENMFKIWWFQEHLKEKAKNEEIPAVPRLVFVLHDGIKKGDAQCLCERN